MKNLQKITFLLCLSLIISCSSNDDDLGLSAEGSLTAKVDGNSFTSLSVAVAATVSNNVLVFQGSNSDGEYIRANIINYNGEGTYKTGDNISNSSSISYGSVNPVSAWISTFNIGSGTITITADSSTNVKGTFSFSGENNSSSAVTTKTITEGTFSAPKQ